MLYGFKALTKFIRTSLHLGDSLMIYMMCIKITSLGGIETGWSHLTCFVQFLSFRNFNGSQVLLWMLQFGLPVQFWMQMSHNSE